MKKILLILLITLICATASQAYVYRVIGSSWSSRFTGAATTSLAEKEGLGSVQFSLHPYTVNTPEARNVKPGTPMVAKIQTKKKAAHSPPITEEETSSTDGITILVTEVGPEGDVQLYATNNVQGNVMPSNKFAFDFNPDVQAWTNDKFVANANVNTQITYVVLIKYKEDSKVLTYTLNVR